MKKFLASAAIVALFSAPLAAHATEEFYVSVPQQITTSSIFLHQEISKMLGIDIMCRNLGVLDNPLSEELRCIKN